MELRPATKGLFLLLASGIAMASIPASAVAQGPTIPEFRRLIQEREVEIARLQARLRTLEQRADSLSRAKRDARPGSARFESVSNEILVSSQDITAVARRLRVLFTQVQDLQRQLFLAYTREIAETQQRIDELTRRPRTDENRREVGRLVTRLEEYVPARNELYLEIEAAEEDLFLPQLAFDARDDPSELSVKQAIAADAIELITRRIALIEEQIGETLQRKRDLEEFRRLKDDIRMWGDDAGSGRRLDQILEGPQGGPAGLGPALEDPDTRIRQLQRRRIELLDRKLEYEAKERLFAQRLREFYP